MQTHQRCGTASQLARFFVPIDEKINKLILHKVDGNFEEMPRTDNYFEHKSVS